MSELRSQEQQLGADLEGARTEAQLKEGQLKAARQKAARLEAEVAALQAAQRRAGGGDSEELRARVEERGKHAGGAAPRCWLLRLLAAAAGRAGRLRCCAQPATARRPSPCRHPTSPARLPPARLPAAAAQIERLSQRINEVGDRLFADLSARLGVASIREYEEQALALAAEVRERQAELTTAVSGGARAPAAAGPG